MRNFIMITLLGATLSLNAYAGKPINADALHCFQFSTVVAKHLRTVAYGDFRFTDGPKYLKLAKTLDTVEMTIQNVADNGIRYYRPDGQYTTVYGNDTFGADAFALRGRDASEQDGIYFFHNNTTHFYPFVETDSVVEKDSDFDISYKVYNWRINLGTGNDGKELPPLYFSAKFIMNNPYPDVYANFEMRSLGYESDNLRSSLGSWLDKYKTPSTGGLALNDNTIFYLNNLVAGAVIKLGEYVSEQTMSEKSKRTFTSSFIDDLSGVPSIPDPTRLSLRTDVSSWLNTCRTFKLGNEADQKLLTNALTKLKNFLVGNSKHRP